jgi:hypothetical protein
MTKFKNRHRVASAALFLVVGASALRAISLTGNVETDFVSPEAVIVSDGATPNGPTPDVGMPPGSPSVISGWDIKDFRFVYDAEEDSLYVGINFFGIAGDADGDGDPSRTSQQLTSRGGQDLPDLGFSEAIQISFDWNRDGVFETIAGTPTPGSTTPIPPPDFLVAPDASPAERLPAQLERFDEPYISVERYVGASQAAPDFEFKIPNVSTLPGFSASDGFNFRAFAGSFQDDGIGEDFAESLHVDLPTPVPEPVAPPIVSLTELIVSRSYFNFWGTAAGEGGIARVEYKTDQRHWTKFVPANGTTSWKFKIRRDSYHSLRVVIRAINSEGDASPEMIIEVQP